MRFKRLCKIYSKAKNYPSILTNTARGVEFFQVFQIKAYKICKIVFAHLSAKCFIVHGYNLYYITYSYIFKYLMISIHQSFLHYILSLLFIVVTTYTNLFIHDLIFNDFHPSIISTLHFKLTFYCGYNLY